MKEIKELLNTIEDPRHEGYVEDKLSSILILIIGAVICGITELCEMMVYFEKNKAFYKKHFKIEKIPSKPTFSRVLNMINPEAVGRIMISIMVRHTDIVSEIIAFDGKAIRGTGQDGIAHSFLQTLSAYATESGVTLAQRTIGSDDKTNEIPVMQNMLEVLNIEDKIITADAMHCQKETCKKITAGKGHYIFGLKGNQKELFENVKLFLDDESQTFTKYETIEKNGGRIEQRVIHVTSDVDWLFEKSSWTGLATIFSITRTVTYKEKTTVETGYYISSILTTSETDAKKLLYATRSHWMIESMHWFLDVVFGEDNNGFLSANAHKVLNSFRKIALFAHKKVVHSLPVKGRPSVKGHVFEALLDPSVCLDVIRSISLVN